MIQDSCGIRSALGALRSMSWTLYDQGKACGHTGRSWAAQNNPKSVSGVVLVTSWAEGRPRSCLGSREVTGVLRLSSAVGLELFKMKGVFWSHRENRRHLEGI